MVRARRWGGPPPALLALNKAPLSLFALVGGGLNLMGAASRFGPSMQSHMGVAGELDDPLWPFADGAGARSMSGLPFEGKVEELWDAAPSMFVQQPY